MNASSATTLVAASQVPGTCPMSRIHNSHCKQTAELSHFAKIPTNVRTRYWSAAQHRWRAVREELRRTHGIETLLRCHSLRSLPKVQPAPGRREGFRTTAHGVFAKLRWLPARSLTAHSGHHNGHPPLFYGGHRVWHSGHRFLLIYFLSVAKGQILRERVPTVANTMRAVKRGGWPTVVPTVGARASRQPYHPQPRF